jgi:Protein of unknown function (DUF5674)
VPEILIVREPIPAETVEAYARAWFGDMVKIVIDVERELLALGGELHADGEELLLAEGSLQKDIWGANVYPFRDPADRLEHTALINIRPAHGNRSMEVESPVLRGKIAAIADRLLERP